MDNALDRNLIIPDYEEVDELNEETFGLSLDDTVPQDHELDKEFQTFDFENFLGDSLLKNKDDNDNDDNVDNSLFNKTLSPQLNNSLPEANNSFSDNIINSLLGGNSIWSDYKPNKNVNQDINSCQNEILLRHVAQKNEHQEMPSRTQTNTDATQYLKKLLESMNQTINHSQSAPPLMNSPVAANNTSYSSKVQPNISPSPASLPDFSILVRKVTNDVKILSNALINNQLSLNEYKHKIDSLYVHASKVCRNENIPILRKTLLDYITQVNAYMDRKNQLQPQRQQMVDSAPVYDQQLLDLLKHKESVGSYSKLNYSPVLPGDYIDKLPSCTYAKRGSLMTQALKNSIVARMQCPTFQNNPYKDDYYFVRKTWNNLLRDYNEGRSNVHPIEYINFPANELTNEIKEEGQDKTSNYSLPLWLAPRKLVDTETVSRSDVNYDNTGTITIDDSIKGNALIQIENIFQKAIQVDHLVVSLIKCEQNNLSNGIQVIARQKKEYEKFIMTSLFYGSNFCKILSYDKGVRLVAFCISLFENNNKLLLCKALINKCKDMIPSRGAHTFVENFCTNLHLFQSGINTLDISELQEFLSLIWKAYQCIYQYEYPIYLMCLFMATLLQKEAKAYPNPLNKRAFVQSDKHVRNFLKIVRHLRKTSYCAFESVFCEEFDYVSFLGLLREAEGGQIVADEEFVWLESFFEK